MTIQMNHLALRMNLIPNPMVIARVKGMVIKKVKAMILVMVRRLRKVMGYRTNPEGMNKMLRTLTATFPKRQFKWKFF
ncbi:Uncharacterised protein [Salmonella enterica subsp. enterica serovar Typhi]|nr:Uncharacterised protein [Salmonella enterica subsp. enterica serovar Typhi]